MQGVGEAPPRSPGHRCWTSASSSFCQVSVRDSVSGHSRILFVFGDQREKELLSMTPLRWTRMSLKLGSG